MLWRKVQLQMENLAHGMKWIEMEQWLILPKEKGKMLQLLQLKNVRKLEDFLRLSTGQAHLIGPGMPPRSIAPALARSSRVPLTNWRRSVPHSYTRIRPGSMIAEGQSNWGYELMDCVLVSPWDFAADHFKGFFNGGSGLWGIRSSSLIPSFLELPCWSRRKANRKGINQSWVIFIFNKYQWIF